MVPNVSWNCPLALLALITIVTSALAFGEHVDTKVGAQDQSPLQTFMRKKLDASSRVLEGLAVEDYDQIRKGSAALLEMSKSELWNVLTDEDYRTFNREFRSSIRKLNEAADEKNIDSALLQWMDATKSCVECHKHVRRERAVLKK